ncbi:MAG TPA: hypothetical protein VIN93_02595 [Bryobacteraceae bacterium]|jgi:hypothetical protein
MGKINLGRVILGGIIAGVIINVVEGVMNGVILQPQWSAAAKAIGRSATMSTKQMVAFNLWGFAAGIIAVWLYAAIRPRFGAGLRTAIAAGAAVWLLAYAMKDAMMAFLHVFPLGLLLLVTAVGLVEVLIATSLGAYFYREA